MIAAHRSLAALAACLTLCACGSQPEPPPVEDTVFGDSVGAMEKARAVEGTTMQHKDDLDRALDSAEGVQ